MIIPIITKFQVGDLVECRYNFYDYSSSVGIVDQVHITKSGNTRYHVRWLINGYLLHYRKDDWWTGNYLKSLEI